MRSVFLCRHGKTGVKQSLWIVKFSLLFLVSFSGCQTTKHIGSQDLFIYDRSLFVAHTIIHQSEASFLVLELPSGRFSIELQAFFDPKYPDAFFQAEHSHSQFEPGRIQVSLPRDFKHYTLQVFIRDMDDGRTFRDLRPVSLNASHAQKLTIQDEFGQALLYSDVAVGTRLRISGKAKSNRPAYVRYYPQNYPPAYPPYASDDPGFDFDSFRGSISAIHPSGFWRPKNFGSYFISMDSTGRQGKFVNCFNSAYPDLTNAYDLIEALRYIAKNSEYEELIESDNPKEALDEFWLERASSKARAKVLISTFYSRVRNANLFFTSYKEGWKTDRGMIYIVFGLPDKILKKGKTERWIYDYSNDRQTTTFDFEEMAFGQRVLRRYPMFEQAWNVEIQKWRRGMLKP